MRRAVVTLGLSAGLSAGLAASCMAADGLVLELANAHLRVCVRPDLGGKIISICDADGRERLSRSNRLYSPRRYGMPYAESEFDGFDEVFPNLTAESITLADGSVVELPDHGEVWTQAWDILDEPGIALAVNGVALPYRLERRLTLSDATLVCDYRVLALGEKGDKNAIAIPYAFCHHPLFSLQPNMRIIQDDQQLGIGLYSHGVDIKTKGAEQQWQWFAHRLGPIGPDSGRFWKVVSTNLTDAVGLQWPDGGRLLMQWDVAVAPNAAWWCSEGGVAGLNHIACEPAVSRHDRLSEAMADGSARLLRPGEEHRWQLRLTLFTGEP